MQSRALELKTLFKQKKYSQIIKIIEYQIKEEDLSSGLINLLGACKVLKSKSRESLESAVNDFRKAYLIENNTKNSLEALKNFIITSMDLFDNDFNENLNRFPKKIFNEIFFYVEKNKVIFETDESFALALIKVYKRFLDIDNVVSYLNKFIDSKNPQILCSLLYNSLFKGHFNQNKFLQVAKKINDILPIYNEEKLTSLKALDKKKINLGFISADIIDKHSITYFLKSILVNKLNKKFNIYLFINSKKIDETTKSFEKICDKIINISNLNDFEAINIIRNCEIDIAFDLMGVTSYQRISLFKNRLAPIQISWCGYCNTTGLNEMDYLIADRNVIKKGEDNLYSEKIIFLPNIWNTHIGFDYERKEYPLPYHKNQYITFGSFNNFKKIDDEVIKVWSEILLKVNNSKLILKTSINTYSETLLKKFDSYGVLHSINIIPHNKTFEDHINEYQKIDLALDTFPYNGVTTSFEAIWMGVPVLTMEGNNFNSRCGSSINKNLNMISLITKNQKDYVAKAVNLSKNINELSRIRKDIFNKAISSPLFDAKSFSNNFYNSLEDLVNNYSLKKNQKFI